MTATLVNTPRTAMIEKQASFSRTACRADESPRSVARPAASAESQIGADNHFWPVLFVVCANFSAWPVCCWVTLSTPRLHQANRSLSFFTLCVLDDVTSLMYVVIIHSTDASGPPLLGVVHRRIGSRCEKIKNSSSRMEDNPIR